jgi:alpha-beta hydrolase superfamily lysophospholipase
VVAERLMSDPVEQQLLRDDELFHSQVTLRLGAGLLDSGAWALKHAGRIQTPLLLSHGSSDSMTSFPASVEFARRAGTICELTALDGELHDPFRGLQRDAVIARYVDFIRGALRDSEAIASTQPNHICLEKQQIRDERVGGLQERSL